MLNVQSSIHLSALCTVLWKPDKARMWGKRYTCGILQSAAVTGRKTNKLCSCRQIPHAVKDRETMIVERDPKVGGSAEIFDVIWNV